MKGLGSSLLAWATAALVPLAVIGLGIRLLLLPAFLQIEYRMPGFPADSFGLTQAERLRWAPFAVDYLVNTADISYLGDLKFDDGTPLYNERELSHMQDVKLLTRSVLQFWRLDLGLLVLLGLGAWLGKRVPAYQVGLKRGGWLLVGLVAVVLVAVAVGFTSFFTAFHRLFFVGETWLFYYSDTLIRLFPMRFWQDCFIFAGLLALLCGLGLALGLKPGRE